MDCKEFVVENRLEVESQKTIAALTDNSTKRIDAEKVRRVFTLSLEACFCLRLNIQRLID